MKNLIIIEKLRLKEEENKRNIKDLIIIEKLGSLNIINFTIFLFFLTVKKWLSMANMQKMKKKQYEF